MKYEIIWSKDAGDELAEIISYIKYNTGKITAEKIYLKIMNEIKRASENAAGRRIAPLLKKIGINYIHQLNINPWIIYYKTEKNKMEIISIIDGRRNLEEILYKKILDRKMT
ncbi:MAG: type II toxin-antitoxin system RelE/ParE family toxin [Treponema sp.]|jgi:toxin ParE1/3/4|nr:type II toxin-antitoxin system RelE/ParE family toxin [Treponema sp.]